MLWTRKWTQHQLCNHSFGSVHKQWLACDLPHKHVFHLSICSGSCRPIKCVFCADSLRYRHTGGDKPRWHQLKLQELIFCAIFLSQCWSVCWGSEAWRRCSEGGVRLGCVSYNGMYSTGLCDHHNGRQFVCFVWSHRVKYTIINNNLVCSLMSPG